MHTFIHTHMYTYTHVRAKIYTKMLQWIPSTNWENEREKTIAHMETPGLKQEKLERRRENKKEELRKDSNYMLRGFIPFVRDKKK